MKRILSLVILTLILLCAADGAWAQAAVDATATVHQPTFSEVLARMTPMFVIVFFIFYFMVMKPQQAKLKAHTSLISSLKKGETLVTSGGIIGRVAGVEKDHILLEVAPNVKIRVEAQHIAKRQGDDAGTEKGKQSDKASNN